MQSIDQQICNAISVPGVQWKNVFVVGRRNCEMNPMTKLEYVSAHLITPMIITEEKACVLTDRHFSMDLSRKLRYP